MKIKYAQLALDEIPRLLSSQDRNPFSPSYGSFNREFWHTRTKCFPDSIAQFGTLSLALIFAHKFPGGEEYYQNKEIKKWKEIKFNNSRIVFTKVKQKYFFGYLIKLKDDSSILKCM